MIDDKIIDILISLTMLKSIINNFYLVLISMITIVYHFTGKRFFSITGAMTGAIVET